MMAEAAGTDTPAGPASGRKGEAAGGPLPLGVRLEATGHLEVDGLVARLGDADTLPTEDHIEVYEDVHRGLRDALTALDDNRS
jgi:hypothetical protein